jgi:hypothetical protein
MPKDSTALPVALLDQLEAELDPDVQDFLTVCTEVETSVSPTIGFSVFKDPHIGKAHYRDLGAGCNCTAMRLFRFADDSYSLCKAHGLVALGYLVRDYSQSGR